MPNALRTIAHVTADGGRRTRKSGTTADVYSINAGTQQATAALGGGGLLNQAYSAISTVPGRTSFRTKAAITQTIHIRGGDYDQVGYEFDGVPVNRSFDNYASSSASSLGNAEVQVYTGANPANSEGQGLAGFINQVIKTGTYPGYGTGSLGIGTPAFYHRAAIEIGGSTPDRIFSYYFGVSGLNQAFNYVNNNNGSSTITGLGHRWDVGRSYGVRTLPGWSLYYGNTGNTYFPQGPAGNYSNFSTIYGRNVVVNLHMGIPHHHDAGRDDVQILYDRRSPQEPVLYFRRDVASPYCTGAAATSGTACAYFDQWWPDLHDNTYTWGCQSDGRPYV